MSVRKRGDKRPGRMPPIAASQSFDCSRFQLLSAGRPCQGVRDMKVEVRPPGGPPNNPRNGR
jgi:hypothetical protein